MQPCLIDHATLITVDDGRPGPLVGAAQGQIGLVEDAALLVRYGRIADLGPRDALLSRVAASRDDDLQTLDAAGRVVMPGFVDAHTHPVFAGSRAAEFEQRIAGASYVEIMEAGGGIASTVRATRAAAEPALLGAVLARMDRLMAQGVTTIEAKTGYGLSTAEELRHLEVLAAVEAAHPIRVVPTFLGAHAVPDEYRGREDAFVDLVVEEMLPRVARAHPGVFCDVFCDAGAFTLAQTERVLRAARALGLPLKVHADEFENLGCAQLAAELGATSADHLVATAPAQMRAMAASGTVGVLLPGTTFGLGSSHYADARAFVAAGVPVALGTDLNPGTCPSESMPLMLAIAARYLRLTPREAIVAATRNAAVASHRGDRAGRLRVGWPADLQMLESDDYRDLAYRFGGQPAAAVMIGGRWAVEPAAPSAA